MASLSLRVYQKTNPNDDFAVILENKREKTSLLFQAGTISTLSQLENEAVKGDHFSRICDSYGCLGILQVCPSEHTQLYIVVITRCIKVCNFFTSSICKIQEVDILSIQTPRPQNYKSQQDDELWKKELKKVLSSENFYFSFSSANGEALDLTLCSQRRARNGPTDNKFFWNRMLHLHPKRFGVDCDKWLVKVGSHKIKMSREPEVSVPAFTNHMKYLREKYGYILVINLMGTGVTGRSQGEASLSHMFQIQHGGCVWSKDSPHIVFDFHQECRGGNIDNLKKKLYPQISNEIDAFGYFCYRDGNILSLQQGTVRSNCVDCLDRTNRVQTFIGLVILQEMLTYMGISSNGVIVQRFTSKLEELWKENGNKISQIYAGTGALQGSKIIDGARSAARTIQNNLLDSHKQEAINIFLHGNLLNNYLAALSRTLLPSYFLYAPFGVLRRICERCNEYTKPYILKVAVGTYNVNGGKHFRSLAYKHLSLDDWLLDSKKNAFKNSLVDTSPENEDVEEDIPDVFAIGFEEIVDLNASNIVQNTQWSENAASWGRELQKVISRSEKFLMVTWAQLVGVALFVFVNERHADAVRDVAVETVKTGMQGATGNKGAVGIRMVVQNTAIAFVCSHFAAGQKEVGERNADYDSIARKLIFPMGIPLWAHDYVFWCGDFNYRLNLPRDEVIDLIQRKEWDKLLEHDQLTISQKEGKCFKGFIEGSVDFAPTYKYDLFSDDYDTSEKCRVPAWTDRVFLWRRQYPWDKDNPDWYPGKILHYGRAELKQSDHRPVLALFAIEGRTIDYEERYTVNRDVIANRGPSDCTVVVEINNLPEDVDAGSLITDDVIVAVQEKMGAVGSVVLVRFVDNKMWFTFADSELALKAVASSPLMISNLELEVWLKTGDWKEKLEDELTLCSDTCIPLTDEPVNITEHIDALSALRGMEGAFEKLYNEDAWNDHSLPMSTSTAPTRPAPSRPVPSRPPPPKPTPPSSPVISHKSAASKVKVITKPLRPPHPESVPSSILSEEAIPLDNDSDSLLESESDLDSCFPEYDLSFTSFSLDEDNEGPPDFPPPSLPDDMIPPSILPPPPQLSKGCMKPPSPPPRPVSPYMLARNGAASPVPPNCSEKLTQAAPGPVPPVPVRALPPVPSRNLPPIPPRK